MDKTDKTWTTRAKQTARTRTERTTRARTKQITRTWTKTQTTRVWTARTEWTTRTHTMRITFNNDIDKTYNYTRITRITNYRSIVQFNTVRSHTLQNNEFTS